MKKYIEKLLSEFLPDGVPSNLKKSLPYSKDLAQHSAARARAKGHYIERADKDFFADNALRNVRGAHACQPCTCPQRA